MDGNQSNVPEPPDTAKVSSQQWKNLLRYAPKLLGKEFQAQQEYAPKYLDLLKSLLPDQQEYQNAQLRDNLQTYQKFAPEIANSQNRLGLDQYKQYGKGFADQNADLADYNSERANQSDLSNLEKYGNPLAEATTKSNFDLYRQYGPEQAKLAREQQSILDPTAFKAREQAGNAISRDLALGSSLDAASDREWNQDIRGAQSARGNILGNAPITSEAMTKGRAGQDLYQRRLSNATSFGNTVASPLSIAGIAPTSSLGVRQTQQGVSPNYMPPSMSGMNIGLPGAAPSPAGQFGYQYLNPGMLPQADPLGQYNAQVAAGQANSAGGSNPWMSAGTGAVSGASFGSMFGPYGTAIGGVAGAGLGLIQGFS